MAEKKEKTFKPTELPKNLPTGVREVLASARDKMIDKDAFHRREVLPMQLAREALDLDRKTEITTANWGLLPIIGGSEGSDDVGEMPEGFVKLVTRFGVTVLSGFVTWAISLVTWHGFSAGVAKAFMAVPTLGFTHAAWVAIGAGLSQAALPAIIMGGLAWVTYRYGRKFLRKVGASMGFKRKK